MKVIKNKLRQHFPYIFFIATLIIVFFLITIKDIFNNVYITPDLLLSDLVHVNLSEKFLLFNYLKQNRIPIITNLTAFGYPILAESQIGALSPINIILYKFLPFIFAFNVTYILSFLTLGISAYFLFYDFVKSKKLSLFGSISLTFSASVLIQITHQGIIQSFSFLPLAFLLLRRALKSNSYLSWVLFGFTLSQQFLFGHFMFHVYTIIFLVLYMALLLWEEKRYFKQIPKVFSAFVIYLLCISTQLINTAIFTNASNRDYSNVLAFSTPPFIFFKTVIYPFILGRLTDGSLLRNYGTRINTYNEINYYMGLVPLMIVFITAYIFRKKQLKVRITHTFKFLLFSFILFFIFVYGASTPFKFVLSLPLISNFRGPHRIVSFFTFFTILGTIILFKNYILNKQWANKFIYILIFLQIIFLTLPFSNYHPVIRFNYLKNNLNKSSRSLINHNYYTHGNDKLWTAAFEDNNPNFQLELYALLEPNSNFFINSSTCGLFKHSSYHPVNFFNLTRYLESKLDEKSPDYNLDKAYKLLRLLGCNILISSSDSHNKHNMLEKRIFNENKQKSINYYKVINPISSFFFTNNFKSYIDIYHYLSLVDNDNNNIETLYIKGGGINNTDKKAKSRIITKENSDQKTVLKIKNNTSGYLYIHKLNYPNWKAYVNSKETEISEANGAFMAVKLYPGINNVELIYQPPLWYISLALMILGYLTVFTLAFYKLLANIKNRTYL